MTTSQPPRRRRARRLATSIGALGAVIALAAGCAAAPSTGSEGNGEPKSGGDLVFQIDSLGDSWVPNTSSISSFQGNVWGEITDKLVYVDEAGELSPWLAESWEQSDDATSFTLHLREGVTFSDGSALDAEAVATNIDFWANGDPSDGIARVGLFPSANYEGAEAVDATTVEVTFSQPTLAFIPTLAYHGSIIVSPKTLELPAEEQADLSNAIGTGPFVVESWADGDHVTITKREDYSWGPDARGHTGAPYLDSITYKVVPEASLRTGSVQSGQADVVYNISPQELGGLKDAGLTVAAPRYLGFVNGFALNTSIAPFNDKNVRLALQHGIDRDEILDTVYTEDWEPAQSFIQSNVAESTDHSDAFEYDPELAQELLDEAGWKPGADGVRERDGERLELKLYPNPYLTTSQAIDELIAQQLAPLGFDVSIQTLDVASYTEQVLNNRAEVQTNEITRSFIDAATVAGVIVGAEEGDEDWFFVGTSDETLNQYSEEILSADDLDARAETLDSLQEYVLEEGYFVPVTQISQRIYVLSPDLHDVTYNGLAYASFATAWLDR
ncbi:ABC transporter substrate-binding protein [Gulosibacter faecalis]|jgi:peptide/nickel transport system substrate-binding protein|uniref:ABC transporter substrate-binding protein n=1 Tax=Gulosibacter faecalis TaxID=272240 RepID=A0ABW5V216_9MICO|nr:ABC transporter substrate-binding protein [Gulosibacter faecalis]